ncbi:MAG TPA: DEAD/DEAH box helicase [Massilibacterium sp.]|nr:DEAD/DEAH box helicase [Massilibacterium sp.]
MFKVSVGHLENGRSPMMAIHHYIRLTKGEPLLIVVPPQKKKEGGWDRDIEFVCNKYKIEIKYEQLSYGMLAKQWDEYKGWFVVFDECHYIKNPTSQRGKAAYKLTEESTNFLLLSATPNANGWIDTINYFIMFGHYKNKTQFLKQHAIYDEMFIGRPRPVKVVADFKEKDKLKDLYQTFSIKLSKDEALDLPPLVFEDVYFKPTKEYKTIEKDRVLENFDELIIYDSVSKLQHGLRFHANQKDKLKYAEMIAEGTEENIVIFYYYQDEKNELIKIMKKLKKQTFEVSGQKSHIPQKKDWPSLKNSVTLVQYMAGSAGIELQYANTVIFYTPTYSYQDYEQALGRCYRNGQTKKVTAYRFITKDTIEISIYAALKNKKDFNEQLFRREFMNEQPSTKK